jgi:hypothetical protein
MASRGKEPDLLVTEITASNSQGEQCFMSLSEILICGETVLNLSTEHVNDDFLMHFGQKQVEGKIFEDNDDGEEVAERNRSPEVDSSLRCANKEHSDNIGSKSNFVAKHNGETREVSGGDEISGFDDDDDTDVDDSGEVRDDED